MGHFRLKLITTHAITPANTPVGTAFVDLKTYPSIVAAEADFYLPEGAISEAIATLPHGHTLLLQVVDLRLAEDHAQARQYLFDGNFKVQTAFGPARTWPYACISSSVTPLFPRGTARRQAMGGLSIAVGNVAIATREEFELTYLGMTTAKALVQAAPDATAINHLPADFKTTMEADARALSAGTDAKHR